MHLTFAKAMKEIKFLGIDMRFLKLYNDYT